jgi:hypothetical protein
MFVEYFLIETVEKLIAERTYGGVGCDKNAREIGVTFQ